jgi:oligopeptidase B
MLLSACAMQQAQKSETQALTQVQAQAQALTQAQDVAPPVAKKVPHAMTLHGVTRIDNYHWLRDDARQDPEMLAHLSAENRYTQAQMTPFKPLQEKLFNELIGRLEKDESSVPYLWGRHCYYHRFAAEQEYPIFARKLAATGARGIEDCVGEESVLLDVNLRAAGEDFFDLGGMALSPDESLLVFGEDRLGRRVYSLQIKEVASGEPLPDVLEGTEGEAVWANDNQYLFYIAKDPQTLLGDRVFRHRLGTPQSDDVLVYEEPDDSFYISLGKSLDGSRLVLYHESTITSEVSLLDADAPLGQFIPFLPREEGHEYSVAKLGDTYYVLTNWQAENFRLMRVQQEHSADKSQWQSVLPYDDEVRIEDVLLLKDYLVVQSRKQGLSHIHVYPSDPVRGIAASRGVELKFDDAAYVVGLDVNRRQDTDLLRIFYSSMTTPESIYEYDLSGLGESGLGEPGLGESSPGERWLLKQDKVLGYDASLYQAERLFITVRDGAKVPVSLVYRKDKFQKDGSNPLYQYGYGAYGYTVEPDFSSSIISLLDRGVVYAIAHVRGSEMLGRPWYDAGKLGAKQNSFNDFIDVTQSLVAQGYGAKDKVLAAGASAGGLLMGAVANQAPELYFAIAAHVPFVDIVTTMLDESLPLTTNEYDEWGNPNDEADFDTMLRYSPYDQVKAQAYPHMLVTTGLHDSQVQYFEPAKWVAKLREYKTDDHKLLFEVDLEAGHGGKSGRYRQFEDTAREYVFLLGLLGLQ